MTSQQCDGRYPVPGPRDEPFPVTYRCTLNAGHAGAHGPGTTTTPSVKQGVERIWKCKIGGTVEDYPRGADLPMREAVAAAFRKLTGRSPEFTFSGWGAELTEGERAVVENREPVAPVETTAPTVNLRGEIERLEHALARVSRQHDMIALLHYGPPGAPVETTTADPTEETYRLNMTGHQAREIVEFCGGSFDTELTVGYFEPAKDVETGEDMPGGLYVCFREYPEEGRVFLPIEAADEPSGPTDADALHANHASSPLGCESDATGTCSNSRRQPEDFRSLAGDERPASASPSEPPRVPLETPKGHEAAKERIAACVREIEIICDTFGYDPTEWVMPQGLDDLDADDVPPTPPPGGMAFMWRCPSCRAFNPLLALRCEACPELRPETPPPSEPTWQRDNEVTSDLLGLVGCEIQVSEVSTWTDEQCQHVEAWAGAIHLAASDNDDVEIPPEPSCVSEWRAQRSALTPTEGRK